MLQQQLDNKIDKFSDGLLTGGYPILILMNPKTFDDLLSELWSIKGDELGDIIISNLSYNNIRVVRSGDVVEGEIEVY